MVDLNTELRKIWRYQRGNQNPQMQEGDKPITKRKGTKEQTMICTTLHIKLKIAQHENSINTRGWTQVLRKG